MSAIQYGHIDIVKTLLAVPGIDVNMKNKVRNEFDINKTVYYYLEIMMLFELLASGR